MRVRPKIVALSMSVLLVSKVPCNQKLLLFKHIRYFRCSKIFPVFGQKMCKAKFFYIIKSKINPCLDSYQKRRWVTMVWLYFVKICLSVTFFARFCCCTSWRHKFLFSLRAFLYFHPLGYFLCFPIKSASNKCQKWLLQKQGKNMPPIKKYARKTYCV
jgi:hypothetical protein